jgi:hypothetical protein
MRMIANNPNLKVVVAEFTLLKIVEQARLLQALTQIVSDLEFSTNRQ